MIPAPSSSGRTRWTWPARQGPPTPGATSRATLLPRPNRNYPRSGHIYPVEIGSNVIRSMPGEREPTCHQGASLIAVRTGLRVVGTGLIGKLVRIEMLAIAR